MPCPTCDHTLSGLVTNFNGCAFWHCERCGTVVVTWNHNGRVENVYRPKLVDHCRFFGETQRGDSVLLTGVWRSIAESINVPADRPQEGV